MFHLFIYQNILFFQRFLYCQNTLPDDMDFESVDRFNPKQVKEQNEKMKKFQLEKLKKLDLKK